MCAEIPASGSHRQAPSVPQGPKATKYSGLSRWCLSGWRYGLSHYADTLMLILMLMAWMWIRVMRSIRRGGFMIITQIQYAKTLMEQECYLCRSEREAGGSRNDYLKMKSDRRQSKETASASAKIPIGWILNERFRQPPMQPQSALPKVPTRSSNACDWVV